MYRRTGTEGVIGMAKVTVTGRIDEHKTLKNLIADNNGAFKSERQAAFILESWCKFRPSFTAAGAEVIEYAEGVAIQPGQGFIEIRAHGDDEGTGDGRKFYDLLYIVDGTGVVSKHLMVTQNGERTVKTQWTRQ